MIRDKNLIDQLPFFQKVSLFQGLSDEQIKKIVSIMYSVEVGNGEVIMHEGANEETLFILIKGDVEISKRLLMPLFEGRVDKQEKSLIRLSEKNYAFFGEMTLFEDKPERSASASGSQRTGSWRGWPTPSPSPPGGPCSTAGGASASVRTCTSATM